MIIEITRAPKTAIDTIQSITITPNNGSLDIVVTLSRDIRLLFETVTIGARGPAPVGGKPEDGPEQQLFAPAKIDITDLTKITFPGVMAPPDNQQWYYYALWSEVVFWPPPLHLELIHSAGQYYPAKQK